MISCCSACPYTARQKASQVDRCCWLLPWHRRRSRHLASNTAQSWVTQTGTQRDSCATCTSLCACALAGSGKGTVHAILRGSPYLVHRQDMP
jgi:hypothetical protein